MTGKFDSPRDEVLFTIAFDSMWNDDHTGNTDSPTGYFAKIELSADDAAAVLADGLISTLDELPEPTELVGCFVITEDSSGFVYVTEHDDIPSMRDAYAELERVYDDWMMPYKCVACGQLLTEFGEDTDGSRYCDTGADDAPEHVTGDREV